MNPFIIRIAKVDPELNLVKLRHNVAGSIEVGNRYFFQNVREALDAPGEWFCDYETGNLYFYPPEDGVPADGDAPLTVSLLLSRPDGGPAPVTIATLPPKS